MSNTHAPGYPAAGLDDVKFAECPCAPDEEAWEKHSTDFYCEDGAETGFDMVQYQCQTCGTFELIIIEVQRA